MFHLTKWYCDCVSADGDTFLGYWAKLSWGPFRLPYVSALYKPAHGLPRESTAIRSSPPPAIHGETLDWSCPELGIHGHWHASQPPSRRTLLDDRGQSIVWCCHVPAAAARVQIAGAAPLTGSGYAEELRLSFTPSRLPFDELRWGRFVSDDDALTWIQWRGGTTAQWMFHNGVEVSGVVDTTSVRLLDNRGVLELGDAVPLQDGPLAATALRVIPGARHWLLRGIGRAHETKWLSRGTLTAGPHSVSGWVIHEVVDLRPS